MLNHCTPHVGSWYLHLDKGQPFQVVDIDEDQHLIELQHFDGDLEEVEYREWRQMALEEAPPPEDWTGPVDDIEVDDLGYSDTAMSPGDWRSSLSEHPTEAAEFGAEGSGSEAR